METQANHYRTLDLPAAATREEIKARFRHLALLHHPDQNGNSPESQARFLLILNAWRVLGDDKAREDYDRYLKGRSVPPVVHGTKADAEPRKPANTAQEFRDSLNSLLWDIEDLVSLPRGRKSVRPADPLAFQKDLLRILTFLDQWVLEPAGFIDYFMEARGLERLSPASYIDFICQQPGRLTHFPFTSVAGYFFDIRKRMNRYLEKLDGLPWLDKIPGREVRFIDALLEAQNLTVHYLSGLRRVLAGELTSVSKFVPSHADFR